MMNTKLRFRLVRRASPAKLLALALITVLILYLLLLMPEKPLDTPIAAGKKPFIWKQDAYWKSLQEIFINARNTRPESLDSLINIKAGALDSLLDIIDSESPIGPDDPLWARFENTMFEYGSRVAAYTGRMPHYIDSFTRLRKALKRHSLSWDISSPSAKDRLYRLLYGGRAGVEEVMLQAPPENVPSLVKGSDEPSFTPAATMLGVEIHSGDILVSRGGAPTSALIARGSDYPGNFSHVALVFVDDRTHAISIIESHIECGVTISTLEKYLKDTKLRIMVLRLRADLPALVANPMLPHKASVLAMQMAGREHIPYDFAMDFSSQDKLFCSEVASAPYDSLGVQLWMKLSSISGSGVSSWLSAFGITHFETQEPSDLEYDPQLIVVAEWRDPETLYKDHIDNAVIDALLEQADAGLRLDYDWYLLPVARTMKAYSLLLNLLDLPGPIPEGMSATAALRNKWFSRQHAKVKSNVEIRANNFGRQMGYRPPYWELVNLSRVAADSIFDNTNSEFR